MESLSQRNQSRRFEREKRRHKVTMAFTVTLCIIAAIAVFAYIINGFINKVYDDYEMVCLNPRQDSNSVRYESYQGKLLKYSRDGASGIKADGTILWNGSYEMNNPKARTCADYVIVGDIGGKEAYVYNGNDSGVSIKETLPIIDIDVAMQGVAAVVLEDASSNEIHIYNPYDSSNSILFNIPTNVDEDGYPVDISLSDDGKKLVTSFMAVNNGATQNKVTFYNLSSVGENNVNFIVQGIDLEQTICPRVDFINNDNVVLYEEQGFRLYSMQEIPEEVCKVEFEKSIKSIMSNKKYLGFVLDDNQLLIYDLQGRKVLDKMLDFAYEQILFAENEIIMKSDMQCCILRFNGEIKWEYTFNKGIRYLFPAEEKDRYILLDDQNIEKIKLSKS